MNKSSLKYALVSVILLTMGMTYAQPLAAPQSAPTEPSAMLAVQQVYQLNQSALRKKNLKPELVCHSKLGEIPTYKITHYKNKANQTAIIKAELGGDDSVITILYHFDSEARLRFIYATVNSVHGKDEKRLYINEQGNLFKQYPDQNKLALFGRDNFYDPKQLTNIQQISELFCRPL